jgi:hypothetical protein
VDRITLRAIALIAGTILVLLSVKPALDWLDLKLVVVSPSAAMPSGGTMVVSGGVGFQPIDSVEAFCKRCYASPTIWCKHRELDRLTRSGDVRFSLPFSETLFRMSGASIEEWRRKEAEQERNEPQHGSSI